MTNHNSDKEFAKQTRRLLKLLSRNVKSGLPASQNNTSWSIEYKDRSHTFKAEILTSAFDHGYVRRRNSTLQITNTGLGMLAEFSGSAPEKSGSSVPTRAKTPAMNIDESPLARLYFRRCKNGKSYLSHSEFQAGESLRRDFERGQLQPKITASYSLAGFGSSANASRSPSAEISDFAIDARARIGKALEALGPELSGVALDICCFLKGFEEVERERQWPRRSAKLMLKTSLSVLAKHYGLLGSGKANPKSINSWGSSDFRPSINLGN